MNRFLFLLYSLTLSIVTSVVSLHGQNHIAASAPPMVLTDSSALPLIDSVIAAQTSIRSILCKYHHTCRFNDADQLEYQGIITYKAPSKILMHFLYPADEYVLVDDSIILLYNVKNEYGRRYDRSRLSSPESQIAEQIGQIRMNILSSMRSGYFFSIIDTSDATNVTVAATPRNGWKSLGKITVTLDMTRRIMKSIELFGKDGPLVSSTHYADYLPIDTVPGSCHFPRAITVLLNASGVVRKDIIEYSRIKFDETFADSLFTVPVSKNATIVGDIETCKVPPR